MVLGRNGLGKKKGQGMTEAVPPEAPDEALDDLRERITRTRRVTNPWADDRARGLPARELDALLEHWATAYNWRDHERRIRSLPWAIASVEGGDLRMIHQRAADPSAPAVVLLHGWPDSVLRFERVLPLLADLHVVVPALPGFPFAVPLASPASVNRIAEVVAGAVGELGYARYTVSGGDVGGEVAEILAAGHPDRVTALHLTNVSPRHAASADPARLPREAVEYLRQAAQWFRSEGGYIAEQSTRPSTLTAALADSPAGLAAWIVEKLTAWSGDVSAAFTQDEILTWVTAYWLTGAIGTSFSPYVEPAAIPDRIGSPTVFSAFPGDIKPAPRSYAEVFVDIREFIEHDAGGHFAAWEQPQAYADDLRRAVGLAVQN
jgi:pimeloyl-ACP methyl ester carboxylesterase